MNATSSKREAIKISAPCKFKLIYIYRITGSASHKNCLKIGDATLHDVREEDQPSAFLPNCHKLMVAARSRVEEQTRTAGLFKRTEILHAEIAVTNAGKAFRDIDVHYVLKNSGIARAEASELSGKEWFVCDLETAKAAISAVKAGKKFLEGKSVSQNRSPIEFRPEQERAIKKTVSRYKSGHKRFLWNAKMRFGKTLCALEVARRMKFKRTIIITHRPDVKDGWLEDFGKIFFRKEDEEFHFYKVDGTQSSKDGFADLENCCKLHGAPYVIFTSIQFLRGKGTGDTYFKNKVAGTPWDFVVVDEAHEGTQTSLGKDILGVLSKKGTAHTLALSGTPFNIAEKYTEEETFTWDYVDEQIAKCEWEENHSGEANPYASLPKMSMRTYSLGDILNDPARYLDTADKAFTFSEFFRVKEPENDDGNAGGNLKFVHEGDVKKFLDLLAGKSERTEFYPFANKEYRAYFRHTFWYVPGVKEAARLAELLEEHDVFGFFEIVNVAGEGNADEDEEKKALDRVKKAIRENEYTITLSCGRLTTGVTVPEWSAVFYLAGSSQTSPATYMQTIFRVQSPGSVNGRAKEGCYVFDFAPDRTLAVVKQVVELSARNRGGDGKSRPLHDAVREFLNFMPIIAVEGSETRELNSKSFFEKLRRYCIDQIVRSGFANRRILNSKTLNSLSSADMAFFDGLKGRLGSLLKKEDIDSVVVNSEGFDNVQQSGVDGDDAPAKKRKPVRAEVSEEEKQRRKRRENAIAILLNVMVRCPLLVFGAPGSVGERFTPENFAEQFDPESWAEFMGKISQKEFSEKIAPCLDETVFTGACSRVRERVLAADELSPLERIKKIVEIHSEFKNPDKETVLTPWRVVNMQLGETLGGWNFLDENFENERAGAPRFIDEKGVTEKTLGNADAKILEINSKTGLYPLYVAYSLMRAKLAADPASPRRNERIDDAERRLWKSVVAENIFVVCRTKMAAAITRRTLLGFDEKTPANICDIPDLLERAKDPERMPDLAENLHNPANYRKISSPKNAMLKFNAIVGNPPYQQMDGGAQASATPVYQHFVRLAKELVPDYFSLIIPARWYAGGKGLDDFRREMLNDHHIKKLVDFINPQDCFKNVDIKGGVCYFLWCADHDGKCEIYSHTFEGARPKSVRFLRERKFDIFIRDERMISILEKIVARDGNEYSSFSGLVSAMKPYGLRGDFFANPAKYGLPKIYEKRHHDSDLKIYGLLKNKRVARYVHKNYPIPKKDGVDKFKIFVTRNYGCGEVGEIPATPVLATPVLATPGEICTETFVQISPFDSARERDNCFSYFKTKFFRLLVGIRKQDQGAGSDVYRFVPVQDFSKPWTDEELYKKYELTDAEIGFIESMIRPMA